MNETNNPSDNRDNLSTSNTELHHSPEKPKVHLMNHKLFITAETEQSVLSNVIDFIREEDPDVLTVDGLSPSLLEASENTEYKDSHGQKVHKGDITKRTLDALSIIRIEELRKNQSLVFADMPYEARYLAPTLIGYKNITRDQVRGEVLPQTYTGIANALAMPAASAILLPMIYLATEAKRGEEMSRREFFKKAGLAMAAGAITGGFGRLFLEHSPEQDLVKIYNTIEFLDIESAWIDLRNLRMRMANQQEIEDRAKAGKPTKSIVLLGTGHGNTIDRNVNDPDYDIEQFKVDSRNKLIECFEFMKSQLEEAEIPIGEAIRNLLRRTYSEYYIVFKNENGEPVKQKKNVRDVDTLIQLVFQGVKG